MNKTVNINLAGIFFHIDEDAYAKLQRYLAAIKRSFEGVQGEDEIIADIEARIAELFNQKIEEPRQVISSKELEEVIEVMGQPEDYAVDEEIFEDTPKQKASSSRSTTSGKRLYRDTENGYIGGVSSGFGHYLGIDPLWIRIAWIILVLFGFGSPILIYILLWILIPEALSTSDKLSMKGKAVNIDNIQQKVKEGFENVADTVKNVDYERYGDQAKKGAKGFFSTIGDVIMFFIKVFGKFIGALFILIGAVTVLSLFISVVTAGSIDLFNPGFGNLSDFVSNDTNVPTWIVLLLTLFAVGIPFFFLFYLGLRIVASNLKSMPLAGKLSLLGLWLISVIVLGVIVVDQVLENSYSGKTTTTQQLNIKGGDTLRLAMNADNRYDVPLGRSNNFYMEFDEDGNKVLLKRNVRLIVRSTNDSTAYIKVERRAKGSDFSEARSHADEILYNIDYNNGNLILDGYLTSFSKNKFRDQEVRVLLYLPEGAVLYADDNTYSYHRNSSSYRDLLFNGDEEEYLLMHNNKLICSNCPDNRDNNRSRRSENSWEYRDWEDDNAPDGERETPDWEDDDNQVIINKDGIDIKVDDNNERIDVKIDKDSFKIKVDN